MILKIEDARGCIEWRAVQRVSRQGWSSEVVDRFPVTSEERTTLSESLAEGLRDTTVTSMPSGGREPIVAGGPEPIMATLEVGISENTIAAMRLHEYWGLETTIHQVPPAPLPEIRMDPEHPGMAFATLAGAERALLWLRIVEVDGREHIEGHELHSAYLMSDTGKTLDSLL